MDGESLGLGSHAASDRLAFRGIPLEAEEIVYWVKDLPAKYED